MIAFQLLPDDVAALYTAAPPESIEWTRVQHLRFRAMPVKEEAWPRRVARAWLLVLKAARGAQWRAKGGGRA